MALDALQLVETLRRRPQSLILESESIARQARILTGHFFHDVGKWQNGSLTPTRVLLTDEDFDCDQIWDQLEQQNRPLLKSLRRKIYQLDSKTKNSAVGDGNTGQESDDDDRMDHRKEDTDAVGGCREFEFDDEEDGDKAELVEDFDEMEEDLEGMEGLEDIEDLEGAEDLEGIEDLEVAEDLEGIADLEGIEDVVECEERIEESGDKPVEAEGGTDQQRLPLIELEDKERRLHEQMEELEKELVSEQKPWVLRGEVRGADRPVNSMLEVHLDLPQFNRPTSAEQAALPDVLGDVDVSTAIAIGGEEATEKMSEAADRITKHVEKIVKFRIREMLFDDVVRRSGNKPAAREQNEAEEPEVLDFKKSKIGLGEAYAQQYAEEILGHQSATSAKEDSTKAELLELFAKVMYKLDCLTNQNFTPRPPRRRANGAHGSGGEVSAITIEDTVPLVVSSAQRAAPEELKAPDWKKGIDEMNSDELKALRSSKKKHRQRQILKRVASGEVSAADVQKRALDLSTKNRQLKLDKKAREVSGVTAREAALASRRATNRINTAEMLAAAARGDQGRQTKRVKKK